MAPCSGAKRTCTLSVLMQPGPRYFGGTRTSSCCPSQQPCTIYGAPSYAGGPAPPRPIWPCIMCRAAHPTRRVQHSAFSNNRAPCCTMSLLKQAGPHGRVPRVQRPTNACAAKLASQSNECQPTPSHTIMKAQLASYVRMQLNKIKTGPRTLWGPLLACIDASTTYTRCLLCSKTSKTKLAHSAIRATPFVAERSASRYRRTSYTRQRYHNTASRHQPFLCSPQAPPTPSYVLLRSSSYEF